MRVIAGIAKGRRLRAPRGIGTRPLTGRAKESVFAILGARVHDAAVLDLYAGSGSIGIEALSRGAAQATFVESSHSAVETLRANLEAVSLGGSVVAESVEAYLDRSQGEFDVVFFDPPYGLAPAELAPLIGGAERLLAADGVMVVHRRHGTELVLPDETMLSISDNRRYGDGEVWWLEKEQR